jgi:hypothetical protein
MFVTILGWADWLHLLIDTLQRLAAKDLDDWEQKRVKRLPGEHDGVI